MDALRELCEEGSLDIRMSMYGGFELFGTIGTRLPSSDVQTKTTGQGIPCPVICSVIRAIPSARPASVRDFPRL